MTEIKQKIVPCLWYDKQAKEAAAFYCSVFRDARVTSTITLRDTPSGDTDIVSFEVWGYAMQAINAGPLYQFNPSISFMVNFDPSQDADARQRIDEVWAQLIAGGQELMALGEYPFSERYGWVQDRYGLSWQLIYTHPEGDERPLILPSLLFVGPSCGKAEEASDYYLSVFRDAHRGAMARYPAGMAPEREGTVMFTDYKLEGQWFVSMDSAQEHKFAFNEAVSLMVYCQDQEEIDYYWAALSAVPEAEQCGWLKDKYGISWQIVPAVLDRMVADTDGERVARVTQAVLGMKKLDLAALRRAYELR
jgi:predicted 3-demethylubiquinone-9 3-methyltransferase (glyoxalase superfamily)